MMKPRLLDLFCGAGGCSVGYAQAGFEVVGVDIAPQPHYPFEFHQADALTFPLEDFDVIHASPPCQGYSVTRHQLNCRKEYPLLLEVTRARLIASRKPWVMENVRGAPMGHFMMLCGTQFNLHVYRHRQFESSILIFSPGACHHPPQLLPGYYTVFGKCTRESNRRGKRIKAHVADGRRAMDIGWMTQEELSQAIPPAYTRWIGQFLYDAVMQGQEVAI